MNSHFLLFKIILIVISSLIFSPIFAEQEETQPSNLIELKAAITKLVKEKEIPAVGIAMVDKNGPVWIGAIGKANKEHNITADENTLFRIGSTSKMFVSLSVLKLVEQGKLSLADKVSDLAPEIAFKNQWQATNPIRIVHLLEHTTGWDDFHLSEFAHNDPTPATLKQGLDFHPHSRTSRWQPGSRMSYCNSGPAVAAYIVEKITGQDFEHYVKNNFFDPIGMKDATYRLSDDVKARGATLYANSVEPQAYWHLLMRPSGAINASVKDMAKFLEFYINRGLVKGQQVISRASLNRMESVKSTSAAKAGQQTGYGLSNYTSQHKSWVYREHNGGIVGGLSQFAYLPSAKLGHVILINSDDFSTFREISKLIRDYETRNLDVKVVSNNIDVTAEHKKIVGFYYPINPHQQASYFLERVFNVQKLWFDGNKLVHKALLGGEAVYYYPVTTDLYKSEKTGLISLSQVNDPLAGRVVHAHNTFINALNIVLKPTSSFLVYSQLTIAGLWGFVIISAILFFLVWIVRKIRGKISSGATIIIRLWPLLAGVSVIFTVLLFTQGVNTPFKSFGEPTVFSIGIMLSTITFAIFAILGVYTSIKERRTKMNRGTYWHSTLSSIIHLTVAIYLLSFGVIGMMTWA